MKRAYLDLALRYHPDRQADRSPAARERAEFQMREVNAAWEVLRNPARRADYDARLRGQVPVWERSGREPVKRTAPVSPRVADLQPAPAGAASTGGGGWGVGVVAAVVAVAVVAILGFAAWATASSRDDGEVEVSAATRSSFDEGSCVVLTSVTGRITAVPVGCSSIGAMAIVDVVDLGRPCPAGAELFDVTEEERRLCLRPAP